MAEKTGVSVSKKELSGVKDEIKDIKKKIVKAVPVRVKVDYNKKLKDSIDNKKDLISLKNGIKDLKKRIVKAKSPKAKKIDSSQSAKNKIDLTSMKKEIKILKKKLSRKTDDKTKKEYSKKLKELSSNKKELANLKKEIKKLKLAEKTGIREKSIYEQGIKEMTENRIQLASMTNEIKKLSKTRTVRVKTTYNKELKESMDSLSASIGKLVELFTTAKEIVDENGSYEKQVQPSIDFGPIVEQNKVIAKGILAITEMLREYLPKFSNESRSDRRYRILRVNKKISTTPLPIEPATTHEQSISTLRSSGLPSVPETDDDFNFPDTNEEDFSQ